MIKFILAGIIALIVIITAIIPMYLAPDDLRKCSKPEPTAACGVADAIVTVSGGDTPARTTEAIRLYKDGWADTLIFSGAAQDTTGPSNAEAMKNQALAEGVPAESIITEEFSRTTAENARNTSQFIVDQDLKRVVLVTSAYHQRRASLEFGARLGDTVKIVNHPVATDKQWPGFWWWTTPGGWWLAISELVKIVAFYSGRDTFGL
jgi:uncharacterized SAM-binding protein YcdF (DUF218 family)